MIKEKALETLKIETEALERLSARIDDEFETAAQAILACKGVVREPFCVINADDYYGKKAFSLIHDWLADPANQKETEIGRASCRERV